MAEPDVSANVATSQTLADQALENLVNQFARPLDFLRELVQNSIDAGSPRVEIWLGWSEPEGDQDQGVLEIHIDDSGEGMDEHLIDNQLTRMFSSTKEDDLTKIGKFGIGFTSIFAIQPDAVLLRTGKHGENWELVFHADRSFDKVRLDVPVSGTRITLFKRMAPGDVERFVRECRWVLNHWCEHSDTPITFWDRTQGRAEEAPSAADPFAAFAAPEASPAEPAQPARSDGPERVSQPMALDAVLYAERHEDGVHAMVGLTPEPHYGFYNGGLTLLSTKNPDALGDFAGRLGHLSFKVKSDHLEHTLTRDNVLQDAHWKSAMELLCRVADDLFAQLVERLSQTPAGAAGRDRLVQSLAEECAASDLHLNHDGFAQLVTLPVVGEGSPLAPLAAITAQEDDLGVVLLAPPPGALRDALCADGLLLLEDRPATRAFLDAAWKPPLLQFGNQPRRLTRADAIFVQPQLDDVDTLPPVERALVETTAAWLQQASRKRVSLRVGRFGAGAGPDAATLALEGPEEGGLFRRTTESWFRLPAFIRRRCLLVNRNHPAYQAQVVAAAEDPGLAALALAQAILHVEGLEGEKTHRALLALATDRLIGEPA